MFWHLHLQFALLKHFLGSLIDLKINFLRCDKSINLLTLYIVIPIFLEFHLVRFFRIYGPSLCCQSGFYLIGLPNLGIFHHALRVYLKLRIHSAQDEGVPLTDANCIYFKHRLKTIQLGHRFGWKNLTVLWRHRCHEYLIHLCLRNHLSCPDTELFI